MLSQAQHEELHNHSLALHERSGTDRHNDADNALMIWYRDNSINMVASDDVSGTRLRPEAVIEARRTELDFFCRMKVCTKVSRQEALARGKQVIQVRWIDINKGDKVNEDYRSRLVAKQFKDKASTNVAEMFAATPPSEVLKLLASRCVSGKSRTRCMMSNDVKRAYFYAETRSEIYIGIPDVDRAPSDDNNDLVGRLNLSMYGTREAASAWQAKVADVMNRAGFVKSVVNPCIFYHGAKAIETMVHGDGFISTGEER